MTSLDISSVVTVCALDLFCMTLLLGLYFVTRHITARSGRKISSLIGIGILLYSLLLVTNVIWIIGEHTGTIGIPVQYVVNSCYYLALSAAPALWFLHVSIEFGLITVSRNRWNAAFLTLLPALVLSVLSVTAYFNGLVFFFDEAGRYERGPLYLVFSVLSYSYIIVSGVIAVRQFIKKHGRERRGAFVMAVYALLVMTFGLLQNITGFEFGVLGFTSGMVLYFGYLITRENSLQRAALQEKQTALEEALSLAQSANRAKTTFLNNMSHDIRTPMNAIIGYTELASSHIDNKEQVLDYLSKIGQSSDHLLSLINDVLDMSRIESGKMTLHENPEDLCDILNTLYDIVQADIRAKELDFRMDTDGIRHTHVLCDKPRLKQVLLNILSNSIKYTQRGGTILLYAVETEGADSGTDSGDSVGLTFRIRDNGMGMSAEFLKTIFDPFTRVNSSTVSGIQGTGLGMAITKSIVDMMGGTISVESEEGKGTETTISVTFRRSEAAAPVETDISSYDFSGKRILLVEDNELNREIATELLTEEGFCVDAVTDGTEAVERMETADSGSYDLILMDIQMPVMNGYEAARRIRALGSAYCKSVPILAMTANAFEEDRRAALEAGMNEHISKPIDISVMKEKLALFLKDIQN